MPPFRQTHRPIDPEAPDPLSVAAAARRGETLAMVRRALERKDVMLAYQPVIHTGNPGSPAFYEGLIRVLDDQGKIIPAGEFMAVAETDEIGRMMDCLALEMGLNALLRAPDLKIAINMSARSIAYPRWQRVLRRGLGAGPGLAERLILEISESSAMVMPDIVTLFMHEQQKLGLSFALDDFGAGVTSFRHLRRFMFDFLKIDGEFIRGIADDPDNQCMTRALVEVGRSFDMYIVAESVESGRDAQVLTALGVDCMQGYFFGAPTITPPWKMPVARRRKRIHA